MQLKGRIFFTCQVTFSFLLIWLPLTHFLFSFPMAFSLHFVFPSFSSYQIIFGLSVVVLPNHSQLQSVLLVLKFLLLLVYRHMLQFFVFILLLQVLMEFRLLLVALFTNQETMFN